MCLCSLTIKIKRVLFQTLMTVSSPCQNGASSPIKMVQSRIFQILMTAQAAPVKIVAIAMMSSIHTFAHVLLASMEKIVSQAVCFIHICF